MKAALCHDVTTARLRQHNNANVLALGEANWVTTALAAVDAFLATEFEAGHPLSG